MSEEDKRHPHQQVTLNIALTVTLGATPAIEKLLTRGLRLLERIHQQDNPKFNAVLNELLDDLEAVGGPVL